MSIQSKLNSVVNTIGASAITGTIAKNKADENELKGNLETNITNHSLNSMKEFQTKKGNIRSANVVAKIKMRQALANEFRDSMASLIGSKITNKNMSVKEKLELQDKLYSMEDNEILANIDLFKNSEDRIQTLKDYRKEV